jgi:hypothetical protein
VSKCGLAIYMEKYLKPKKRRIMEIQIIFHPYKNIIFKKKSSSRNQNPSRY